MKRYQILYNKTGFPLCVWKSSEEALQTGFGLLDTPLMCGNTRRPARAKPTFNPPDDGPRKRPKPPGGQPGKVAGTAAERRFSHDVS